MANWIRDYRIIAGVPGTEGFEIGEMFNGRALHVNFDLEKSDTQSSNTGKLTISNLNDEHKAILNEKECVVEIRAGYIGNLNTIFIGGISKTSETLNGADRDLEMELVDGFSNIDKPGSISMNDVVLCREVVDEIVTQMEIESVHITDAAAEKLESVKYDNGYAYIGKMKAALQKVCRKADVTFSVQNGVLQIYVDGEGVHPEAYVLSAETGLISIPKKIQISKNGTTSESTSSSSKRSKDSTKESGIPGYEVDFFINGAIGVNDLVIVEHKTLNGTFRVHKMHYSGDNYQGDWICKAELVEAK